MCSLCPLLCYSRAEHLRLKVVKRVNPSPLLLYQEPHRLLHQVIRISFLDGLTRPQVQCSVDTSQHSMTTSMM